MNALEIQPITINIIEGTQGAEFDSTDLHIVAGAGTIWVNQTGIPQVILPDNQETRRVMTLASQGEEGAVWMMGMRSPVAGIFRWRLQSNPTASITITTTVPSSKETN